MFGAFKKRLKNGIHSWNLAHPGQNLDKYKVISEVAFPCLEATFQNKATIRAGFAKAGLYPWDTDRPDVSKLATGKAIVLTDDEIANLDPCNGTSGPAPAPPIDIVEVNVPVVVRAPSSASSGYTTEQAERDGLVVAGGSSSGSGSFSASVSRALGGDDANHLDNVLKLTELGYGRSQAVAALTTCSGDFGKALDHLLETTINTDTAAAMAQHAADTAAIAACEVVLADDASAAACQTADSATAQTDSANGQPLQDNAAGVAAGQPLTDTATTAGSPRPSDPSPPLVTTVPEMTMEERKHELGKFEQVMLTPSQIREFESLFQRKEFKVENRQYQVII